MTLVALALLVCSGAIGRGAASAQDPQPSVAVSQLDSASYPEMTAVVTVLDANGTTVRGLPPEAFTASDGANAVQVAAVQPVLDASLSLGVVLIIDVSGSMEGEPLAAAKAAATAFVRQLDPADEAALLAFQDDVQLVIDFTTDREALVAGIDGLVAAGATSLYEAVQAGVFAARSSQAPRQAIVMLSDGQNDTLTSDATEAGSLDSARGAGVPVFAIGFGGGADPAYLGRLADASGGRYSAASATDVAAVYTAIAQQLRGQYALTLRSTAAADGADASLVVAVDVGGQRVQSPPAPFVRGEAPPAAVVPTSAPRPPAADADTNGGTSLLPFVLLALVGVPAVGVVVVVAVRQLRSRREQRERDRVAGQQSDQGVPPPFPGAPFEHAPERHARVSAVSGDQAGTSVAFGSIPIVIGSDKQADVRLASSREVAPKHALLWVREGKIMLRHTGGVRQTLSAGRPVDWLILEDGDEFSIGPYHYRVEVLAPNGSAPSAGTGASN
ncbi:MAG: VWA domain-containing protein [Dehalococcoidia bacterium]